VTTQLQLIIIIIIIIIPTGISWLSFNLHVLHINIQSTADEEAQQLEGDGAQNCHPRPHYS